MFDNHWYNQSTRRMVSVFGSMFNDLEVHKYNAAGKVLSKIKVPLAYAPRSKVLARLSEQTSDPKLAIKLPRMSLKYHLWNTMRMHVYLNTRIIERLLWVIRYKLIN